MPSKIGKLYFDIPWALLVEMEQKFLKPTSFFDVYYDLSFMAKKSKVFYFNSISKQLFMFNVMS